MPYKNITVRNEYSKQLMRERRELKYGLLYPHPKPKTHTYALMHRDGSPSIFTITVPIKYIVKISI